MVEYKPENVPRDTGETICPARLLEAGRPDKVEADG
jgi:hypothetical protein